MNDSFENFSPITEHHQKHIESEPHSNLTSDPSSLLGGPGNAFSTLESPKPKKNQLRHNLEIDQIQEKESEEEDHGQVNIEQEKSFGAVVEEDSMQKAKM